MRPVAHSDSGGGHATAVSAKAAHGNCNPQLLNRLLALATAAEPDSARELQHAIALSLREGTLREGGSLSATARQLLALQHGGRKRFAVAHCDFRGMRDDPLWMRQRALASLRQLAGHRDAVLLVTGLRQAFFPTAGRKTRGRIAKYLEFKCHLEQLALRYSGPQGRLRLIYF